MCYARLDDVRIIAVSFLIHVHVLVLFLILLASIVSPGCVLFLISRTSYFLFVVFILDLDVGWETTAFGSAGFPFNFCVLGTSFPFVFSLALPRVDVRCSLTINNDGGQ